MKTLAWPAPGDSARGHIDGPDGALEVAVTRPDSARGIAVICHPHPQQGGTLDNKVVYMTSRAATQAGLAAVRFNFRGTGESAGAYDDGVGERDDLRVVRDWACAAGGLDLTALAGFSFGSAVAVRVAVADGAPALVTVGLPSAYFEDALPRPDSDWLAIFGDADEVIDVEASIAAVRELEPVVAVRILEGAGHFLHGRLSELRKHVLAHLNGEGGN